MEENNLLNEINKNKFDIIDENFNQSIEILPKRGKREKHFLQENGDIIATMYSDDVHFEKDGSYEEIDNRLVKIENFYRNKNNSFKVYFNETNNVTLMGYELLGGNLNISILNGNNVPIQIVKSETKFNQVVKYENIFDGIDFEYDVTPAKVKENIIIKNRDSLLDEFNFIYKTNLKLELNDNGSINAIKDNNVLFVLDVPYIMDLNGKICNNVYYDLEQIDDGYKVKLLLDINWLNNSDVTYPVVIDPTITTEKEGNLYDTYIYPGDTNVNRNSQVLLKAGVEKVNSTDIINRTLIKFDLPTIGTGSQVYQAVLNLICYPIYPNNNNSEYVNIHRVTQDWQEETANWSSMNDKFEKRVEATCLCTRSVMTSSGSITEAKNGTFDITSLVKKWYSDTPNYGVMLKASQETYKNNATPMFFSKDNNASGNNPKPIVFIRYKNQNGVEDYMNYITQSFTGGMVSQNTYNGNLIAIFQLGGTIAGKMPIRLGLIYNTNDVVLNNNFGYGLGYKLSLQQTIKQASNETDCLEYLDDDGTIHYFYKKDDLYEDEDNLNMTIQDNELEYILKDKSSDIMTFTKRNGIGYLTKYVDGANNEMIIHYNENNLIDKITDANNQEINISYTENKISIISPDKITDLNYENNNLISISSYDGTTYFNYNDKHLIASIKDKNGTSVGYQYYDQVPYKIKRVIEYGINNGIGTAFVLLYGNKLTTILDDKGKVSTINYNDLGNSLSVCNLQSENNIKDAYATTTNYGNSGEYKNRLLSTKVPERHVKNYLNNTGFENTDLNFQVSSDNVMTSIITEEAYSGSKCLKIVNNGTDDYIYKELSLIKGHKYTFSAYLKNTNNAKLVLGYEKVDGTIVETEIQEINSSNEYEKYDISIEYPLSAFSGLYIKVYLLTPGTLYLDNIQLEDGDVANLYNYCENSDFSQGLIDWEITGNNDNIEVINLEYSNIPALRIKMKPEEKTNMKKILNISGKTGDEFSVSLWYKNNGISFDKNIIEFKFNYTSEVEEENTSYPLNPSNDSWQYFSKTLVAKAEYSNVEVVLSQEQEANELYITNLSVFKGTSQSNFDYDKNGNVTEVKGLNKELSRFNYDANNNLIKEIDSNNKKMTFEYDNVIKSRLLNGFSETGISINKKYDLNGNIIIDRTSNNSSLKEVITGLYYVRLKGTEKYLRFVKNVPLLLNSCKKHDKWYFEKNGNYFSIKHSLVPNKYLSVQNNKLILSGFQNDASLFEFSKNDSGSYLIKLKNSEKYLKANEDALEIVDLEQDNYQFQFFFETTDKELFIEEQLEYTNDGRFVKTYENSILGKVKYDIDTETGLINFETDAMNNTIFYTYDNQRRLSSVVRNDRQINYEYNDNNLITKIKQNDREYEFIYDEFLNEKEIKIGNKVVQLNNYDSNNGNINSIIYGNNDSINFEYDEFGRIINHIKMDDKYKYVYGNNENLLKVISNEHLHKFEYDLEQRLLKYIDNQFSIKYQYGVQNIITNKKYQLLNDIHNINTEYNEDNDIIKTVFDNNDLNYTYDYLGRVINTSINNSFNIKTEYVNNGKRTSMLVKSIILNNDKYSYSYNKKGEIIAIHHNGNLENRYFYDTYNQLIKDIDYVNNRKTIYEYDILGNLLLQKIYNLTDNALITQKNYEYSNSNWKDQITKFNNDIVTYDLMGNPLTLGNNISLSWINGRELNKYEDSRNIVNYKYNVSGIRTSKIVNNITTEYYLEGTRIVYEKTNDKLLYYIYDDINDLVGFKYNNDLYYYIKNNNDDIIGILDGDYNVIVRYSYDSFGNIISIIDAEGNDVSTNHNHIANINPFRYRSYYYDSETGLYYLNQRYYSPKWGRFISPDNLGISNSTLSGYNLYAYADNNPINNVDEFGNKSKKKKKKKATKKKKTTTKTKKKSNANSGIVGAIAKTVSQIVNNIAKQTAVAAGIPDYSKELNRAFAKNAGQTLSVKKTLNPQSQLSFFYVQEKPRGDWDYKRETVWNKEFDVPYLGLDGPFLWNGRVTTAEEFGNIHYGAMGTLLGIDPKFLFIGGGYARSGIDLKVLEPPYYGDDAADHEAIVEGINMIEGK